MVTQITPMIQFLDMCKQFFRVTGFALWSLLWLHQSGWAQQTQPLPDSVVVSDSAQAPGGYQNESSASTPGQDSVHLSSPSSEEAALLRKVPDSVLSNSKADKDYAYANDPAYWKSHPDRDNDKFSQLLFSWATNKWFRRLLFAFLVLVVLFALYKVVVENKLYLFYSSPKKPFREAEPGASESLENWDEKIQESIQKNDFRSAIRFMHLKAIKMAADGGILQMQARATNQHYLNQLLNHPQKDHFKFLTRAYEHVWFGRFELTPAQFSALEARFDLFFKTTKI
jgi:hypothetical protein